MCIYATKYKHIYTYNIIGQDMVVGRIEISCIMYIFIYDKRADVVALY